MLEQPIQRAAQSSGDGAEQRQAPVSAPQQPQHRQHAAQRQQISVAQEREPGQQPEKGVRHGAAQRVRQGAIESHHGAGPPRPRPAPGTPAAQGPHRRRPTGCGRAPRPPATRATPRASSAARQGSRRNNSRRGLRPRPRWRRSCRKVAKQETPGLAPGGSGKPADGARACTKRYRSTRSCPPARKHGCRRSSPNARHGMRLPRRPRRGR